jgi:hypothetical protein
VEEEFTPGDALWRIGEAERRVGLGADRAGGALRPPRPLRRPADPAGGAVSGGRRIPQAAQATRATAR